MINEEKIRLALESIIEEFSDAGGELTAKLERVKSFAIASIHSFTPAIDSVDSLIASIGRERDRRIDSGFNWNGMRFQSRPSDRENIMGAAQLAMAFIGAGGDPSSLRWANPDADFEWILENNGRTTMSAADVLSLLQAGIAFKSALTFYARDLKDAVLNAEDPLSVDIINGWPE